MIPKTSLMFTNALLGSGESAKLFARQMMNFFMNVKPGTGLIEAFQLLQKGMQA